MRHGLIQRVKVIPEEESRVLNCGHPSLLDFDTYANHYCVFELETGETLCGKCSAKLVWHLEK